MPRFLAVIALVAGTILGWFFLVGFCNIPGIAAGTACGHNAYVWLPLFIPLGILVTWFGIKLIRRSAAVFPPQKDSGNNEKA